MNPVMVLVLRGPMVLSAAQCRHTGVSTPINRRETMSQGHRGSLRIYLGSAAGVGKTYAMLCEGHRRAERGTDVVAAFVETHGRSHTAALLDGLEVVPRARIPYRDTTFEEMDLDAVLARKPQVALVDELAHTNVPGIPQRQALAGRGGTAQRGHRGHHQRQHPAPRIPQRRRRQDHRRAAARDRARRRGPRRRPGRARGHDPGGAAPPDGPRQHLRLRTRSTPRSTTTSGPAT